MEVHLFPLILGLIEPPTVDRLLHLPVDIVHGIAEDAGFIKSEGGRRGGFCFKLVIFDNN